jgi:cell division septation protein DedD
MALFGKQVDDKTADARPAAKTPGTQTAWGAWVVIVGLSAIVTIFGLALLRFEKASDVATAVGAVSGVIAALVGAYFGIRGSSVAQAQVIEMMGKELELQAGTQAQTPALPEPETPPPAEPDPASRPDPAPSPGSGSESDAEPGATK